MPKLAQRSLIALGWIVLLLASGGCPAQDGQTTQGVATAPSPDLSLTFHLEPQPAGEILPSQTLTYRVVVDKKGLLNAGVEFQVSDVPAGFSVSVNPPRIAETARETQLIVQAGAGVRAGDYFMTLGGRLTGSGPGGPDWTPYPFSLRVPLQESGFSLSCDPQLPLAQGRPATLTCRTIRESGFTTVIDVSFPSRPPYLTIHPETASIGPNVGGFVFTVTRAFDTVTPASSDLVVVARSGGLTRQSIVRLLFL